MLSFVISSLMSISIDWAVVRLIRRAKVLSFIKGTISFASFKIAFSPFSGREPCAALPLAEYSFPFKNAFASSGTIFTTLPPSNLKSGEMFSSVPEILTLSIPFSPNTTG